MRSECEAHESMACLPRHSIASMNKTIFGISYADRNRCLPLLDPWFGFLDFDHRAEHGFRAVVSKAREAEQKRVEAVFRANSNLLLIAAIASDYTMRSYSF